VRGKLLIIPTPREDFAVCRRQGSTVWCLGTSRNPKTLFGTLLPGLIRTGRSTFGWLVQLEDSTVSWRAKRHETVALSTIEAEYTALSQGARELAWIRNLFSELQLPLNVPILLNGDNQGSLKLCRNPELHQQTKHIPFVEHHIREEIEAGNIDVQYVSTHEQIADGLAKPLDAASHGLLKQFELVQAQLKKVIVSSGALKS
jgi:hypothetical protein